MIRVIGNEAAFFASAQGHQNLRYATGTKFWNRSIII